MQQHSPVLNKILLGYYKILFGTRNDCADCTVSTPSSRKFMLVAVMSSHGHFAEYLSHVQLDLKRTGC
jgi:hypothetical protein